MKNSPYLDRPSSRSPSRCGPCSRKPRRKFHGSAGRKSPLQERAEVLREWLTPKSTIPLSTSLRRADRRSQFGRLFSSTCRPMDAPAGRIDEYLTVDPG